MECAMAGGQRGAARVGGHESSGTGRLSASSSEGGAGHAPLCNDARAGAPPGTARSGVSGADASLPPVSAPLSTARPPALPTIPLPSVAAACPSSLAVAAHYASVRTWASARVSAIDACDDVRPTPTPMAALGGAAATKPVLGGQSAGRSIDAAARGLRDLCFAHAAPTTAARSTGRQNEHFASPGAESSSRRWPRRGRAASGPIHKRRRRTFLVRAIEKRWLCAICNCGGATWRASYFVTL